MNYTKPLIATAWDGNHIMLRWVQSGQIRAFLRIKKEGGDWSAWADAGEHVGGRLKLETNREGWYVEAKMTTTDGGERFFTPAKIIKVSGSFRLLPETDILIRRNPFACVVRGHVAAFCPRADCRGRAGVPLDIEMSAAQSSPFNELDLAGEFSGTMRGIRVENLSPTNEAMVEDGSDGRITAIPMDGPICIA